MSGKRIAAIVAACTAAFVAGVAVTHYGAPTITRLVGEDHHAEPTDARLYTCGMHPQVVQAGPGTCPICQMNLTPLDSGASSHVEHQHGAVRVSKNFLQNFSIRTTVVKRTDLPARIRTIGYLEHDEAKLVSVSTKFEGWIERPRFNTVGEQVSRGDVLFEVYSPQLVTAQE